MIKVVAIARVRPQMQMMNAPVSEPVRSLNAPAICVSVAPPTPHAVNSIP